MATIAPRVAQGKITRLYQRDARGIVDEELIEEVGYALLFRCESCLSAGKAKKGAAPCPDCGEFIHHQGVSNRAVLRCPHCGWHNTWKAYKAWYQSTWLAAEGLEESLREYVDNFSRTKDAKRRMVLIDILIHRLHGQLRADFRPDKARIGALNLIAAANYAEIKAFLDGLAYGEGSTPELLATRRRWNEFIGNRQR